jgi:predicted DNA-binding transcriptional regulator AlpA
MSTKIEIEQLSSYELEQLIRKVTREELQYAIGTDSVSKSQNTTNDDFITRKKFLELTGKSESWLSKNMKDGNIPYHRIKRSIFFKMSEVLEFAKRNLIFHN